MIMPYEGNFPLRWLFIVTQARPALAGTPLSSGLILVVDSEVSTKRLKALPFDNLKPSYMFYSHFLKCYRTVKLSGFLIDWSECL